MTKVALEVNSLVKTYGKFTAVSNLGFTVKEGEIFGLLGPNGAGKTTTLECIEGVKSFDSGSVSLFGRNIIGNKSLRKLMGVQLQSTSLQGNITVAEAMTLFCKWQKVPVRMDLLNTYGLGECHKKKYNEMSTGQKRKLHLALATAHNPKLLILDEPTAGLDVEGRYSLHNEIRRLKQEGVTIIMASHDMAEVEELCDRVAIIIKGKVVTVGTPAEITSAGRSEQNIVVRTQKRILLSNRVLKSSSIVSSNNDEAVLSTNDIAETLIEIAELVKKNNDRILDIKLANPSLEESFMELVNDGKEKKGMVG